MKELVERLGQSGGETALELTSEHTTSKHYSAGEIYKMVKDALKSDRIEVRLQPVVTLPQRKPVAYECYSHIRFDENSSISAQDFMDVATSEGLMGAVDNIMLFRAIQMVRKSLKRDALIPFFCNVSEYSVANTDFVESLCEFISSHKELLPSLILEVNEGTLMSKSRFVRRGLDKLVDTGCQFSLHQLEHTSLDIDVLMAKNVRYVKFDGPTLYGSTSTQKISDFSNKLRDSGIKFIATHIETEDMAEQCVHNQIQLAQGYLFSEPKEIAI